MTAAEARRGDTALAGDGTRKPLTRLQDSKLINIFNFIVSRYIAAQNWGWVALVAYGMREEWEEQSSILQNMWRGVL